MDEDPLKGFLEDLYILNFRMTKKNMDFVLLFPDGLFLFVYLLLFLYILQDPTVIPLKHGTILQPGMRDNRY